MGGRDGTMNEVSLDKSMVGWMVDWLKWTGGSINWQIGRWMERWIAVVDQQMHGWNWIIG